MTKMIGMAAAVILSAFLFSISMLLTLADASRGGAMRTKFVALFTFCLVASMGLAGCESNSSGTFVPMGEERVLDTRSGQVWIQTTRGGVRRIEEANIFWAKFGFSVEGQDIELQRKFKDSPPPPPPPEPEPAHIEK